MKRATVQGQTVPFRTFKRDKNIEGGLLETSIEIQAKNHILHFSSLYRFVGSGKICGGDLSHVHYLHLGRNWIPASSVLFYIDRLSIEYIYLPIEALVVVGNERYTFVPDELNFHDNGEVMSGRVKVGTTIDTKYGRILAQNVSFNESGFLVGVVPFSDITLSVSGREYCFKGGHGDNSQPYYSINFSPQSGEIVDGILSDGELINFSR